MLRRGDLRISVHERPDTTRRVWAPPPGLVPHESGLAIERVAIHQLDDLATLHPNKSTAARTCRSFLQPNMDPQRLTVDIFDADDLDTRAEADKQLAHASRVRFHESAPESMT
jgi:hypothetical protein